MSSTERGQSTSTTKVKRKQQKAERKKRPSLLAEFSRTITACVAGPEDTTQTQDNE